MVTIKRNTGWIGVASRIKIKVNGEKSALISEGQTIEIELPADESSLKATQLGVRSNEIIVRDGDILEIHQTKFYRMILPIIIVIQVLFFSVISLDYRLFPILSFFVLVSMLFIEGFRIEIISRGSS